MSRITYIDIIGTIFTLHCTTLQVDVCGVEQASVLPVAKYFLREYGKVGMLDSSALMVAVNRGPVALGKSMLSAVCCFGVLAKCTIK